MQNYILLAGRAAGVLGILMCVVAAAARVTGHFYLGGLSAETLLQAGTAGAAIGNFLLLVARSWGQGQGH
jgi:hypothetical protein